MNMERLEWLKEQLDKAVENGDVELEYACLQEMDKVLEDVVK